MAWLSSVVLLTLAWAQTAAAHEVLPSIADMTQTDDTLSFDVRLNIESLLAGVDLSAVSDTNDAPQAATYDSLRAEDPATLADQFRAFWPTMAPQIAVTTDAGPATLTLDEVTVPETGDVSVPRTSQIRFTATMPESAQTVQVGWAREFGTLVLRQQGVEAPYDGYLEAGAVSDTIALTGGNARGVLATFLAYIPVGFDHIVPLGLDHILFVLGLFFLSTHFRPLLWQVTAFTLAHTITLALAGLGIVSVPASIVEPLIAASIIYVAVENLFTDGLSPWRPFVIFGFGLLHGLGFASVLAEFGLPESGFFAALIGFNIGVELGQLAVIAVAYLCVFKAVENAVAGDANRPLAALFLGLAVLAMFAIVPLAGLPADIADSLLPLVAAVALLLGLSAAAIAVPRFESYREIVAMPASVIIALIATYWFIERVFL